MPTQIDALGAFAFLADNLPTWSSRLSDLTAHTSTKHAEFAEAFKKHSSPTKTRRRKNSSVCSINTSSVRSEKRRRGSKSGSDSPDADNSSSASSNAHAVISTRQSLIIHYDGYTQKILEEMVRNIGTARNNLRKGKMAQMAPSGGFGMRSPPPRSGARSLLPSLNDSPEEDLMASIRSSRRGPRTPTPDEPPRRQSPFDLADKNLELAHSFCETAAYNFLRAGGCATELNSVKDRFSVLLKLATEEVQLLEKEKREQQAEEAEAPPKEKETEQPPPPPASLKRSASSEGVIEVDDEQGSVESIDLSAFRVNPVRR